MTVLMWHMWDMLWILVTMVVCECDVYVTGVVCDVWICEHILMCVNCWWVDTCDNIWLSDVMYDVEKCVMWFDWGDCTMCVDVIRSGELLLCVIMYYDMADMACGESNNSIVEKCYIELVS